MAVIYAAGAPDPGEVLEGTWGHLKAQPDVQHPGVIVFAEAQFGGERVILHADFGPDAGYGPWFFDHVHAWLYEQDAHLGRIYTFTGWYRTSESSEYGFSGEITSVALTGQPASEES